MDGIEQSGSQMDRFIKDTSKKSLMCHLYTEMEIARQQLSYADVAKNPKYKMACLRLVLIYTSEAFSTLNLLNKIK